MSAPPTGSPGSLTGSSPLLPHLDIALGYAARGWAVFPLYEPTPTGCSCVRADCGKPGKHPRTPDGLTSATRDPETIRGWWQRWPKASIGLATGRVSGVVVVDVDPKDGGADRLDVMEQTHGSLTGTLTAWTGGGGVHLFFQCPAEGFPCSVGKNGGPLGPGLDVRGDGGYVVAAPSLHASGKHYEWPDDAAVLEPQPLPEWVLRLEADRKEAARARAHAKRTVVRGAAADDFEAAVRAYNAQNSRQYPPRGEHCALCPSESGFKAHPSLPDRWSCWSSRHAASHGGHEADKHWWGDALDIDAGQHRRSRAAHLIATGYWKAPMRIAEAPAIAPEAAPVAAAAISASDIARVRSSTAAEGVATTATTAQAVPLAAGGGATVIPLRKRESGLTKSFGTLCDVLELPDLARYALGNRRLEWNEMAAAPTLDRKPIRDVDVQELRRIIEQAPQLADEKQRGLTFPDTEVWKALALVASKRPFHPVREYLSGLQWDGVPRIAALAEDVLHLARSPLVTAVLFRFLLSCVARAFRPGCKVDSVLVLAGPQGTRKSTFFRVLAGEWFSDTPMDLHSKDSYLQLREAWLYEWAELEPMNRARDADMAKAFISSSVDTYRVPYGRQLEAVPRTCVIVGSTNREDFLTDGTGNRRFWPVAITEHLEVERLTEWRDQLWAEAYAAYQSGEQWHLTEEESRLLGVAHAEHAQQDAWEALVEAHMASKVFSDITTGELLEKAIGKPAGQWTRADEMRVGRIMRSLGFASTKQRFGKTTLRLWKRAAVS